MKTYILSLDRDVKRRERLINSGVSKNIVNSYWSAFDASSVDQSKLDLMVDCDSIHKYYYRSLRVGEIGCAQSHREIYKDIINNNIDFALILEDDAILKKNKTKLLLSILNNLKFIIDEKSKSVILLYYEYPNNICRKIFYFENLFFLKKSGIKRYQNINGGAWYTTAYIINNSAARSILENEKKICLVADDWNRRINNQTISDLYFSDKVIYDHIESDSMLNKRIVNKEKNLLNNTKIIIISLINILLLFFPIIKIK